MSDSSSPDASIDRKSDSRGGGDVLYDFIERLFDPDVAKVFRILYESDKELSEMDIAEKTGLRLNAVRRALNMLAEKGLVSYKRIKPVDKPYRGLMLFLWRIDTDKVKALIEQRKRAVVEKLRILLEHEKNNYYYICPLDGTRYTLDEALEYNFTCPRCGSSLVPDEDREIRIRVLERYVARLEAELRKKAGSR